MPFYILHFTFYMFLVSATCLGQPAQNLFTHISVADGLYQRVITDIEQDNKGYIWIAAGAALQRYDGRQFVNFITGTNGIPAATISGMVIDKKNRVWILTDASTLGYIDADKLVYHPVKVTLPPINDLRDENSIYADQKGNVFVVFVGNAIIAYNELLDEASAKNNLIPIPKGFRPLSIWQDKQLNYWIGTHEGLVKYNSVKKTISYDGHNEDNDEVINQLGHLKTVNLFYIDKCNRCWVNAWPPEGNKVFMYDYSTKKLSGMNVSLSKVLRQYNELYDITETAGGRLWISGVNAFIEFNCGSSEPLQNFPNDAAGEYSIKYDAVYDVFEDREHNIWVSTNKGVYRFNPTAQVFRTVKGQHPGIETVYSPDISNFMQTTTGEVLVSSWGASMFSYNENYEPQPSAYVTAKPPAEEVLGWGMLQRKNGDVWWGHQNGWLTIFEGPSKMKKTMLLKEANGKTIRQLVEDRSGNVWVGTQGGYLIEWQAAANQFIVRQKLGTTIHKLLLDSSNELWVCTEKKGVFRIDVNNNSIIANYNNIGYEGKRLISNWCFDMLQYDDSTIIITAGGLNMFNKKTSIFTYLTDPYIVSIAKDKKGNLWTAGSDGIVCWPADNKRIHYTFDERDGVVNLSFNVGAAVTLANGDILFGTNHDFVIVDPKKALNFGPTFPQVQVSALSVNEKWLSVDSVLSRNRLDLDYKQNSLTIRYTTNSYQNMYSIMYMLEGADKEWKEVKSSGEVNLSYLAPGKYVLKAASMEHDGRLSGMMTLSINISPPFYRTWWFFVVLGLIVCGQLYWLDHLRLKRKEDLQEMRTSIAGKLHNDVSTALGNINVLSEMALLKADAEPAKSKEFIEQIQNKSSGTITAMEDMLWAISPNNDSMEKTAERMREYVQAINNREEAQVEMLIDENVKNLKLDMQLRHQVFLLFKDSLTGLLNAGVAKCRVHVGYEKAALLYQMEFSNAGCDLRQLNNFFQSREMASSLNAIHAKVHIGVNKSSSDIECRISL